MEISGVLDQLLVDNDDDDEDNESQLNLSVASLHSDVPEQNAH